MATMRLRNSSLKSMAGVTTVLGMLMWAPSTPAQNTPPPIQRELRAAWVATVSNIDWPSSRTLTIVQQQTEVRAILDALKALKMNAAFVQVRPQCDALYDSMQEPWSEYLTNVMGNAPSPFYDPLNYWIQEGRSRGIEIHAWVNPYRAKSGTANVSTPEHVTNSHPHIVRTYGTNKWLDPGHPESVGYSQFAVMDLVNRYDIDGIVFDDYFYPYPISGQTFDDATTYAAYQGAGGTLSLANWRRKNVDDFVQTVYTNIKLAKPWVKFGIAPFGIWRPNNPPGVSGLDAYASIYADSKKWLNNGWCDIFSPQLYWQLGSSGQPYGALIDWWTSQNTQGRVVAPSNATYQVGSGWATSEIVNQIVRTRTNGLAKGNVHYSVKYLKNNTSGITTALQSDVYATHSLIPQFTWLDNVPPPRPGVKMDQFGSVVSCTIYPEAGETPRWYAVYTRYGDTWSHEVLPALTQTFVRQTTQPSGKLHTIFISAIDRCGNESARRTVSFLGDEDTP